MAFHTMLPSIQQGCSRCGCRYLGAALLLTPTSKLLLCHSCLSMQGSGLSSRLPSPTPPAWGGQPSEWKAAGSSSQCPTCWGRSQVEASSWPEAAQQEELPLEVQPLEAEGAEQHAGSCTRSCPTGNWAPWLGHGLEHRVDCNAAQVSPGWA